jgi:hypothetical protein
LLEIFLQEVNIICQTFGLNWQCWAGGKMTLPKWLAEVFILNWHFIYYWIVEILSLYKQINRANKFTQKFPNYDYTVKTTMWYEPKLDYKTVQALCIFFIVLWSMCEDPMTLVSCQCSSTREFSIQGEGDVAVGLITKYLKLF